MGEQMQEYAVSQVLHWFRRFDDYRIQQNSSHWQPLPEYHREDFTIGILGAGVLGSKVAQSLQTWRFPLRCWSRTRKSWPGVQSFAGREELSAFLSQCRVLINLLPNTLKPSALLINNYSKNYRMARISSTWRVVFMLWKMTCSRRWIAAKLKAQCWMFLIVNPYRLKVRSGNIHA